MNKFLKPIIGFMFITLAISFANTAQAASKEQLVKKGNALFSSGKYDEAISTYDEAAVDDPESPYIYFNKGAALYKKQDYPGARDAFGQAALKTKDIGLEAKSKFNLGLCFFREGDRQKDGDLKKTLEAYGSSVQSFQEAQALDPKFFEATENIEMVRLMMKSLLDQIKKQEEEAQKKQAQAQKTAEKIKELIEKQKDLLNKSQSLMTDEASKKTPDGSTTQDFPQNQDIADAQEQLKNETQHLSEQLTSHAATPATPSSTTPSTTASPSSPEHPSKQQLDTSVGEQKKTIDQLTKNDTQTAADHQEKSLDALNKALEALKNDQKNQQKGQQQKQGQGAQQPQDKNEKNKEQKEKKNDPQSPSADQNSADQNKPDENQQQNPTVQLPDDANNILNEEKENKKQRMPFSPGGFKKVDKDW